MEKTFISTQKFLITSPRKIRLVVALIKKMKPLEAIEKLPFIQKRAGESLAKVIKSAVANAKNQGVNDVDLVIKEIQVGEGPRLKRGMAASRGRWHPVVKRMSHIRVVLQATKSEAQNSKTEILKKEDSKSEVKTGEKEEKSNGTKS